MRLLKKLRPFVDLGIQFPINLLAGFLEPCRKRLPSILAVFCAQQVLLWL